MKDYLNSPSLETPAFLNLRKFIAQRQSRPAGESGSFEDFEKELHRLFQDCEREILAGELARYDVEAAYVTVDGVRYRRALRASETYVSQAGPLRVEPGRLTRVRVHSFSGSPPRFAWEIVDERR